MREQNTCMCIHTYIPYSFSLSYSLTVLSIECLAVNKYLHKRHWSTVYSFPPHGNPVCLPSTCIIEAIKCTHFLSGE